MPTTSVAVPATVFVALIAAAALFALRPADDQSNASHEFLPRHIDEAVAAAVQRQNFSGTEFVVPSSYSSLLAVGRCERGQAQAIVTPNRPFRSLTAMVIDVPVDGRIRRPSEFFVEAIDSDLIEGRFSDGDRCTLRLVGPGNRGPVDPAVPTNAGNV